MSSELVQKVPIALEEEMKSSFMDYAMSVIVSRALPDARDGLKPVHRRILYTQQQLANFWNRPFLKSARVVGDCMGKFHPHGDSAIYDALVRMAQDFSMRYTLADGQGNWGSVDGDPPAAMRYTEVRMSRIASEMMQDIDKETVDWSPNYDEKELEPQVLPTRLPNLLVNGSTGIAVGMATNIPPHNLTEVLNGAIALARSPELTTRDLMKYVTGPDFPTGGFIYGRSGIRQAFETGRGSVVMRGKAEVEENKKTGRESIVVTEIPYMVNKARWITACAELVKDKKLEGISDIRDESDREGMRVVIELKRDAMASVVTNNLYKQTALQSSFGVMMLAIVDGRPKVLTLRDALAVFVDHRREVVTRRTVFELREAKARREIVEGLGLAIDAIDRIIAIIRSSPDPDVARRRLCQEPLGGLAEFLRRAGRPEDEIARRTVSGTYFLNDRQAQAILEMRLQRLTGLEQDKITGEYREVMDLIADLIDILAKPARVTTIVGDELKAIRGQFGDERRSEIVAQGEDLSIEDLIAPQDMVVTMSHGGYMKAQAADEYRAQRRGGRGKQATATKEDDFVERMFIANTHDYILCFSNRGRVYWLKVYNVPQGSRASRGKPIVNLVPLADNEKITAILPVKEFTETQYVFMATAMGTVKKTPLADFSRPRPSGIIAVDLADGDRLIGVALTDGQHDVMLFSSGGKAVRFDENDVRPMGRNAHGVRGMALDKGQKVIALLVAESEDQAVLTATENGYGKRTPIVEYTRHGRGTKGMIAIQQSSRNGKVVAAALVSPDDEVMLISTGGVLIRTQVKSIREMGRSTQGVTLINLSEGEKLAGLERVLERGFVLVHDSAGHAVTTAGEAKPGTAVSLRFADGEVSAHVDGAAPAKAAKPTKPTKPSALASANTSLYSPLRCDTSGASTIKRVPAGSVSTRLTICSADFRSRSGAFG